ncbi:Threonine/homoserine efflux transporter RhtA [Gracilibacillus ureilyticus]|uniref:Threonine/homoserine efflux transporter RhtA n=1 Tax=Gracilibacillus ureilyticus TaxID=531814 RepID=A0A1H9NQ01_9BACI|nr:DMT family transporter [Gracilibacillus ureilyticus]SER37981.1 Threonine/homoserine efflux transporter RhtA [Gracilibacillus ureilyticus]
MKSNRLYPYLAIVIGVIAVSSAAILVKLASNVPAAIIANYRLLFAAILMLPFVFIKRAELQNLKRQDWITTAIAGVCLAIHFIVWFESLNYTSVASSVVIVTLQPIFAFIGTYLFFKERFSSGTVISMLITIFGSMIIAWGDFQLSSKALYGDFLALLGALFITVYFLLGQGARKKLSMTTYTCVAYLSGSITLIIYNIIVGNSFIGYNGDEWIIFIFIAIIPTIFGLNLLNWALKWVSTSIISMGIVFEPVGAAILAYFILGEHVSWSQWLGGMIVISGLLLFIASTRRKRKMKVTITP